MGAKSEGQPKDALAAAITKKFGSFEEFTTAFKDEKPPSNLVPVGFG